MLCSVPNVQTNAHNMEVSNEQNMKAVVNPMMNRKESLYVVIGGCVGAVLTMMVCSFLPLGVQSQSDEFFGEIICSGLKVVDTDGRERIVLGTHETEELEETEFVDGKVQIRYSEVNAAFIKIWGEDRKRSPRVEISGGKRGRIDVHGKGYPSSLSEGSVGISGRNGVYRVGAGGTASMNVDEHGGRMEVSGKVGVTSMHTHERGSGVLVYGEGRENTLASIGATEFGKQGFVAVWGDTENDGRAMIRINEHGGRVDVWGRGDSQGQVGIGVNEYGNGTVSTWDTNGYRLATLK